MVARPSFFDLPFLLHTSSLILHTYPMKLLHIRSRKACEVIMRKGQLWKGKTMTIRWMPGTPRVAHRIATPGIYLGTYASTKLHKSAVQRNRMRRRAREACRIIAQNLQNLASVQLLVSPRIASLDAPFETLLEDTQTFFSALPAWPTPPPPNQKSSTI